MPPRQHRIKKPRSKKPLSRNSRSKKPQPDVVQKTVVKSSPPPPPLPPSPPPSDRTWVFHHVTAKNIAKTAAAITAAIAAIGIVRYRKSIMIAFEHRKLIRKLLGIDWRRKHALSRSIRDLMVTGNSASAKQRMGKMTAEIIQEVGNGFHIRYLGDYEALSNKHQQEYIESEQAVEDIRTLLEFSELVTGKMVGKQDPNEGKAGILHAIWHLWSQDESDAVGKASRKIMFIQLIRDMSTTLQMLIAKQEQPDPTEVTLLSDQQLMGAARRAVAMTRAVEGTMKTVAEQGGHVMQAVQDGAQVLSDGIGQIGAQTVSDGVGQIGAQVVEAVNDAWNGLTWGNVLYQAGLGPRPPAMQEEEEEEEEEEDDATFYSAESAPSLT